MLRSLIEGIVEILNEFPSAGGISDTLSPSTIVTGKPKLDLSKDKIVFGAYALVYIDTTNDIKSRAVPAIVLRRSNNAGGHYFMSLYSGMRIYGYKWKELPIDEYVLARVEELAEAQNQPLMHNGVPNFEWNPGDPVVDVIEDEHEETLAIANHTEAPMELDQIEEDHIDDVLQENVALPIMDAAENDDQPHVVDESEDIMNVDNEEGLHAVIEDNMILSIQM